MNSTNLVWKEDGEANKYVIINKQTNNWVSSILLNGEMTIYQQEEYMNTICPKFNDISPEYSYMFKHDVDYFKRFELDLVLKRFLDQVNNFNEDVPYHINTNMINDIIKIKTVIDCIKHIHNMSFQNTKNVYEIFCNIMFSNLIVRNSDNSEEFYKQIIMTEFNIDLNVPWEVSCD